MELFTKKHIVLKIVIALVIVILFNFCAPTISNAAIGLEEIGGTLLSPIMTLITAICDGAMGVIQDMIMGIDVTLIRTTKVSGLAEFGGLLAGAGAAILAVVLIPYTGGLSLELLKGVVLGMGATVITGLAVKAFLDYNLPGTFFLPVYAISPEEMFKNQISLLDVNFFNPKDYSNEDISNAGGEQIQQSESSASVLQSAIGSWYIALRNFALVVLLSVLVYIGIRIIFSSTSQDKAKYKEKLFSWVVAIGILFFMHYIMAFATTVVQAISEGITKNGYANAVAIPLNDEYDMEIYEKKYDDQGKEVPDSGEIQKVKATKYFEENGLMQTDSNGTKTYYWPTNLMGEIRIQMQLEKKNSSDENILLEQVGYTILFVMFFFYTVAFLFVYIKRLIMLAFLTMIAPLVAMTYPLDKINDGNAQAFNMWLKEYIFNLLLQPLHLILYTMLVTSAIGFAKEHMIYAIVALGFIFQAEKILRKFFGFEKASAIEGGSAITGALAMAGINQLNKLGKVGNGKKSGGNDNVEKARIFQRKADKGSKVSDLIDQRYGGNAGALPAGNQSDASNAQANVRTRQGAEAGQNNRAGQNYNTTSGTEDYYRNMSNWRDELREQGLSEEYIDKVAPLPNFNNTVGNQYGTEEAPSAPRIATNLEPEEDTRVPDMVSPYSLDGGDFIRPKRNIKDVAKSGFAKAGAVAKGVGAVAGQGVKYVAPKAARLALKGGLAAGAATIGVAAGLATSDDKNILKFGAAGAAAGMAAGGGLSNVISSATGSGLTEKLEQIDENIRSTYTTAAYGEDAEKDRQKARIDELAKRDKNRRKQYANEFKLKNEKEINDMMNKAQIYRKSGITDDDIIIKAMKADGFGDDIASKERVILAGLAAETGNNTEEIEKIGNRLQEKGVDKAEARKYTDGIRSFYSKV